MSGHILDQTRLEQIMGPTWPIVHLVFDALPLAVTITDAGGVVVYCNSAQLDTDGVEAGEILGKFLCDVFSPYANSVILYCLSVQKPVLNRWQYYDSPTKKNIHANNHAFPLFQDGRLTGCLNIAKSYPKTEYAGYFQDRFPEEPAAGHDPAVRFGALVGRAPAFRKAIQAARSAAENRLPVLIYGETGVGKELFARGLHNASARRKKPFVAVNCSAIPENLFEGLMFGVSKGAFTGAEKRPGFFEEANGGTIYLDELDSLPPALQPKVLRVLQENEVRRLGSRTDVALDVKVISSVAQAPLSLVERGLLRADLFYRLGAALIPIPPLRERPGDLSLLVSHFIEKHAQPLGKRIQRASPDFLELLEQYHWPGNVRELEHVVTGALTLAGHRRLTLGADLTPEYFRNFIFARPDTAPAPDKAASPWPTADPGFPSAVLSFIGQAPPESAIPRPPTPPVRNPLMEHQRRSRDEEKRLIADYLRQSFGNVALAARLMGLPPQKLHYKIKKYGIDVGNFKA